MIQAPKWYEPSIYKLYVCPASSFDKQSLKEVFSQYAEIVDVYISEPKDNGYKWAFIYFESEAGLEDTVRKIEENNVYKFKLNRARPKLFAPSSAAVTDIASSTKLLNGVATSNGIPYVTPPNCVHCKKLTFQQCISCKNAFCSKDCQLDGWRSHTGSCIKVAELYHANEPSTSQDYALAPTVVNFLKDITNSKKKFTSDEFAEACNYRGMVNISSGAVVGGGGSAGKEEEHATYEESSSPSDKCTRSSFDKNKKSTTPFIRPLMTPATPASDNEESDLWSSTSNKSSARISSSKKHTKRNTDDESNDKSSFNRHSSRKSNHKYNTDTEDKDNWGSTAHRTKNPPQLRKSNRKHVNDRIVDDADSAYQSNNDKPTTKQLLHQKKHQRGSDAEDLALAAVSEKSNRDISVDFKKKSSTDPSKRSVKSKERETNAAPIIPATDLKLREGSSVRVMVTSIMDKVTFYVADAEKSAQLLRQIINCADDTPQLDVPKIDTTCLAFFEGAWYRAKIISTNPILVDYIDYGNKDRCNISDLKMLPAALSKTLPLATKVQLNEGNIVEKSIRENEEFDIYAKNFDTSSNAWIVDVL